MMFCPKCGAILKTQTNAKGKAEQFCSCGFTTAIKEDNKITEKIDNSKDSIEIVDDKDSVHPLTDAECPHCGHDKANYWLRQTRSGDEPETKFFKCEKCKKTWRDYD